MYSTMISMTSGGEVEGKGQRKWEGDRGSGRGIEEVGGEGIEEVGGEWIEEVGGEG